jgi:hypothetical protein
LRGFEHVTVASEECCSVFGPVVCRGGRRGDLLLSAFGDRVDDSAARSDAGDESVVCELRQARVHRTGKGPILRAGPLTEDADQLVAVPGLLGDRVQESKWCVVVSAMSSASPRSLNCRPA